MRTAIVGFLVLTMVQQTGAKMGDTESETPWGQPANGLCTRVILLEKEPKIGRSLRVRMEVKNVDATPKSYQDQQIAVNGSVIVKGPDGKEVPYIDTSYQTSGNKSTLAPGASKVIVKDLDIAQQYLLDTPGKYTIQFRERGGLPTTNTLAVTVLDGELPDRIKLFASLHRNTPAGWRAAKMNDAIVLLSTPTNLKRDATSVSLYFTKPGKTPEIHLRTKPIDLGTTKLGHAWLVPEDKVAERWPEYQKFFEEQLKPFASPK